MLDFLYRNTIKRLLHPAYRTKEDIALLAAFFSHLREIKDQFVALQNKINYDIKFNAQTLSLETRLNQQYNLVIGTIYIENLSTADQATYIFWLSENQQPTYIGWLSETAIPPIYTYWLSETLPQGSALDFIVWVPTALTFDPNQMKAIINLYKLAGKRYAIQYY